MKSLSGNLRTKGYALAIASSEEDCDLEAKEISAFLARRVDALILASSQRSASGPLFERMEGDHVPFVLADRKVRGLKAHFVGFDDRAIGRLATEHLIERGYRRIAHIRRPGISTGTNRFRGYEAALKDHGLQVRPELVVLAESGDDRGEQCGFDAMRQLLSLRARPDAVFCYNDIIGYGALKAIRESGLQVPSDVAVVGVSNLAGLAFWDAGQISLTTVDQDIPAMAEALSNLVLDLIEDKTRRAHDNILLPAKLVVRAST